MVYLPLWKIWVRQLGHWDDYWWLFPQCLKTKTCSKPPTSDFWIHWPPPKNTPKMPRHTCAEGMEGAGQDLFRPVTHQVLGALLPDPKWKAWDQGTVRWIYHVMISDDYDLTDKYLTIICMMDWLSNTSWYIRVWDVSLRHTDQFNGELTVNEVLSKRMTYWC